MITRFTSPKVKEPAPKLWSNCIVCDGVAYISGLTSRGDDDEMQLQDEHYNDPMKELKQRYLNA